MNTNFTNSYARMINIKLKESAVTKKKLKESSDMALQLADLYEDHENSEVMERWLDEKGLLELFNNSSLEYTYDMFDEVLNESEQQELYNYITDGSVITGEQGIINALIELLYDYKGIRNVRSFEEAGVMTKNLGIVITTNSGKDYQLQLNGSWR